MYSAEVDSIIHPVSAEYMIETIDRADRDKAALVVFTLRTPGGLLESTRDIVTRMLAATTPVAIFVGPSGARAASAGFILTIAADVAAMAPGTHIGAAHPVSGNGEQMDETMSKKAAADVAAYVRTLAGGRQRNVTLAEQAVNEAAPSPKRKPSTPRRRSSTRCHRCPRPARESSTAARFGASTARMVVLETAGAARRAHRNEPAAAHTQLRSRIPTSPIFC